MIEADSFHSRVVPGEVQELSQDVVRLFWADSSSPRPGLLTASALSDPIRLNLDRRPTASALSPFQLHAALISTFEALLG